METVNERLSNSFLLSIFNDHYIIVDHCIISPVNPDHLTNQGLFYDMISEIWFLNIMPFYTFFGNNSFLYLIFYMRIYFGMQTTYHGGFKEILSSNYNVLL